MPQPTPETDRTILSGHLVVFTGKLSTLGRRDARALVARLGGSTADDVNMRTTMLVVGGEGFPTARPAKNAQASPASDANNAELEEGQASASNKLKRAEEINAERDKSGAGKIEILSEDQFCRLAGVPTLDSLKRQYHAMRDLLSRYRELREDHLRYLVKCGIIHPVLRTNADVFFAFPALAAIKQVNESLERGGSFRSAVRALMPSLSGQLAFDFRLDAEPAKILTLTRRQAPQSSASSGSPGSPRAAAPGSRELALAEEYFRAGSMLDERHSDGEANLEEAAAAYRKALELDPYLVAALINLANIHYSRDELAEAQALYERAIGLEPDFFEAHFNLGNIYHDLGRFPEAQACYREALRLNPQYPDAHFYLAVTFEKMGLSPDARPHWRAYQQLAPNGEWVELAKEFSE